MLDATIKRRIDPTLTVMGRWLAERGATPNGVTISAFLAGMIAAAAIANGYYMTGLVLLLLSRLGDGLDGWVARASGRQSDFGGFLDITLDFAFYGAIPLAFVLADPATNGVAGAFLLLTFYINGASFLSYAWIAEKRGVEAAARGQKSLLYTTGLAEATETITVFVLMCLWPDGFVIMSWLFGVVCLYTGLSRIMLARRAFA